MGNQPSTKPDQADKGTQDKEKDPDAATPFLDECIIVPGNDEHKREDAESQADEANKSKDVESQRNDAQPSKDEESQKNDAKPNEKKQMRMRIIFFAALNIALIVLIGVTGFYLANERAPPEPNYKLCLRCEDIRGHPDDPLEHIIETDGKCCLDDNKYLKYLVEPYASRWMKMKMHEENNTFKVCNNVSRKRTEKPSIKVMGLSHIQTHEHHRLHWDHNHEMAIKPSETLIKYRPDDGQIEIMKTGLYHVYNQVHFKIARGTAYNPAQMGHWVYVKRTGTIEQSEDVLMHNMETECEGSGPEIVTSSFLGSDFQLSEGDRLYVKVNKKETVIPEPHLNYFGVHML